MRGCSSAGFAASIFVAKFTGSEKWSMAGAASSRWRRAITPKQSNERGKAGRETGEAPLSLRFPSRVFRLHESSRRSVDQPAGNASFVCVDLREQRDRHL